MRIGTGQKYIETRIERNKERDRGKNTEYIEQRMKIIQEIGAGQRVTNRDIDARERLFKDRERTKSNKSGARC